MMMRMSTRPSYWDYIRVEELLSLQGGLGDDDRQLSNDEVRFITIHQIDELWMKLALRELEAARDVFRADRVPETELSKVTAGLRRAVLIFDLAARHFQLMETMRTQDYLRFRDKLSPASGFQSAQFRELEILIGLDEKDRLPFGNEAAFTDAMRGAGGEMTPALQRVQRRQADRPTLKEAVYAWLYRTPIDGSSPADAGDEAVVEAFIEKFLQCHAAALQRQQETSAGAQALTEADQKRLRERYRAEQDSARRYLEAREAEGETRRTLRRLRAAILFIDTNRDLPLLSWPGEIVDGLIELEQALLVFRQRHARMVERVIGRRVGTGGSDGVAYLDRTALEYRVFTEVWAARTLLLAPEHAPALRDAAFYDLRQG